METRKEWIGSGLKKLQLFGDEDEQLKGILSALGGSHPLHNSGDVFDCIMDHYMEYAITCKETGPPFSAEEVFERIVTGLANPLRSFSFSVPLSDESPVVLEFEIGGPHQLRVEQNSTNPNGMSLKGIVDAPTLTRAIYSVEEVLKQFDGHGVLTRHHRL